jgi:hypothetical protein
MATVIAIIIIATICTIDEKKKPLLAARLVQQLPDVGDANAQPISDHGSALLLLAMLLLRLLRIVIVIARARVVGPVF